MFASSFVAAFLLVLVSATCSSSPSSSVLAGYAPDIGPKECLPHKFRPSNFTVETDTNPSKLLPLTTLQPAPGACSPSQKIYLTHPNGTKHQFFIKGVGYSPIFPSRFTFNHTFDFFQSKFRYLWNRDLDKMKEMGANTIRVWNWDTAESHSDFMDLLYEKGLYLLVPFDSFTLKNYPDLTSGPIRQQVLMDWRAFLKSVMYYPAVLGYMIGNELNRHFGAQREGLFSIINDMIAIRDEIDPARHLVTLPLADAGDFKQSWVEQYYNWAAIDFWSIQSYRPDAQATTKLVEEYYNGYLKHSTTIPLKPLVFTEFGTDALTNVTQDLSLPDHVNNFPGPVVDQRRQANYLCSIFSSLRDATAFTQQGFIGNQFCNGGMNTSSAARVVAGAVLMEWNDEWWKGTYADVRAKMCPNTRGDVHGLCSHNIGDNTTPNFIHEEWLGINAQIYDSTENQACLCPRLAYITMKNAFTNCDERYCVLSDDTPQFCHPASPEDDAPEIGDTNCSVIWCATQPGIMRRPEYSIAGPVVIVGLVLAAVCIRFRYCVDQEGNNSADDDDRIALERSNALNAGGGGGNSNNNPGAVISTTSSQLQARDTMQVGNFAVCIEKRDQAADLQREHDRLKKAINRAFLLFCDIDGSIVGEAGGPHQQYDDGMTGGDGTPSNQQQGPPPSAAGDSSHSAFLGGTTATTSGDGAAAATTTSSSSRKKCVYFKVSQDKLFNLIWDKYCGMEQAKMIDAVSIVFRQMMEGYHIYREKEPQKEELENLDGMLEDLALYNIVQTWAGTINHCPEKVCEIFEFSRNYFIHCVQRNDRDACAEATKDFHHGLVEVIRVYYLKVDQAEFSYDDVNTDALLFRKKKDDHTLEMFWQQEKEDCEKAASYSSPIMEDSPRDGPEPTPTAGGGGAAQHPSTKTNPGATTISAPELELLPTPPAGKKGAKMHPYLEYHKQSNPEDLLLSVFANSFFALHAIIVREGSLDASTTSASSSAPESDVRYKKFMDRDEAFPLNGGVFTLLFNYGWIIRYLLWQWIIARFFQPVTGSAPMCICELMQTLALSDSGWQTFSALCHRRTLGRFNSRVIMELTFYGLCFVGLVAYNIFENVLLDVEPPASMSNFFLAGASANTFYVLGTIVLTAADEIRLMVRMAPPFDIPARFASHDSLQMVRATFVTALLCMTVVLGIMIIPTSPSEGSFLSRLSDMESVIKIWPDAATVLVGIALGVAFIAVPYVAARMAANSVSPPSLMLPDDDMNDGPPGGGARASSSSTGYRNVDDSDTPLVPPTELRERPEKIGRTLKEEANQLGANLLFWAVFFAGNVLFNFYVLVPSVKNIDFDLCKCDPEVPQFDQDLVDKCKITYQATCGAAVIFVWIAAVLVSFAVMYSVFAMEMLTAGFFRAKYLRVGNIKTWEDVESHWQYINDKCLSCISASLDTPHAYTSIWNSFMDALYKDSLLSSSELKRLKCEPGKPPNLRVKPRSEEAFRRITYHLWSLESALNHKHVGVSSVHTPYRKRHRVRTMPPWTCLVPCYDETVIFEEADLCVTKVSGKAHFRISTIEYLVHTYSDEWDNFAERMKNECSDKSWAVSKDTFANDLMQSFLRTPGAKPISEDLRFEIRWWATMRGQTLARTIAGLVNWRDAIVALMRLEEGPDCTEEEIQAVVTRKCQILISHQTANPHVLDVTTHPKQCHHEEALELTFRRLKHFEVAYNDDSKFQSVAKKVKSEVLATEWGKQDVKYLDDTVDVSMPDGVTVRRKKYNLFRPEDYEYNVVQRVGRLRVGEGKAENQVHALQFVRGAVLQAMDMNQYTTTENGFKVPFILSDYFGTPALAADTECVSIIPQFRILGFPEWAYTRSLSMVGEFMGAAEWCFVTITQRVLDWPLRIRAHYGHPDFFDAYWVKNRGGQSKASRLVNTNEDIFAAYEMFGRGDRGAFVEFLEAQKGRESTFGGACVFEAKLAMGGAQQVRSFDLYRLNRNLNLFDRYALCFSSLAFYFTNLVMAISVMYYVLSIALFAVSGVSFHRLGLMDSAIAVPWLFQIGYVLAFPYIIELSIQLGFLAGIARWLRNLIPAIVFFVFHLRTKMYFFSLGILMGKGGYSATGRGFGLDRTTLIDMFKAYSASHFKEALLLLAVLFVYGIYGSDPLHVYMLRCASIIVIVVSWIWAPVVFNPVSTASDLQTDFRDFVNWVLASRRTTVTLDSLVQKLRSVHVGRVLTLVNFLESECREVIQYTANSQQGSPAMAPQPPPEKAVSTIDLTAKSQNEFHIHTLFTAIPNNDDINDGFTRVMEGLAKGKPKLENALRRATGQGPDEKLSTPSGSLDQMFKDFWGNAEKESWIGWYLKGDIMLQWEAEDQFFPGLLNLVMQKALMNIELYAPWIILASDRFHVEALWFLGLILALLTLKKLVIWGFQDYHEHLAVGQAALLVPLPFALAYYLSSNISFSQTVWSLVFFNLIFCFIVRAYFGATNAYAKYTTYGFWVRPFYVGFEALTAPREADIKHRLRISVTNRAQEAETTNLAEENRLKLFKARMGIPGLWLHDLGVLVPLLCLAIMCIGNFLVVLMSSWVTTMNLNGRVSEAWKKAYLRPLVNLGEQFSGSKQQDAGGASAKPSGSFSRGASTLAAGSPLMPGSPVASFGVGSGGGMMVGGGGVGSGGHQRYVPLNRDMEMSQTQMQDIEASMQGSISASLLSQAGASMRAVRSRARGTVASQSVLGRGVTTMFNRPADDAQSDLVSNTQDASIEPFAGTTSRIIMGDQQGSSSRNLGRR